MTTTEKMGLDEVRVALRSLAAARLLGWTLADDRWYRLLAAREEDLLDARRVKGAGGSPRAQSIARSAAGTGLPSR